jgi:hydroxymethylglutaryl-CoA lyase
VVEVGPRDGLQSFSRWVDTGVKVEMIDRLSAAGLPVIEAVSFASPNAIPHLRDAEEVMERIKKRPGTTYRGLAPNRRGAERALATGVDEIAGLVTASATYTSKNQRMSIDQAVGEGVEAFRLADRAGRRFVMGIGMALWCPYEGRIPEALVLDLTGRFWAAGVRSYVVAGSMGMEDPVHVAHLFSRLFEEFPGIEVAYHVHNMAGMATANIIAALQAGVTAFEGSICGLGGGVATPRPIGNLPTEDIVQLLNTSGLETGLSTTAVVDAARDIAHMLDLPHQSHALLYGTREDLLNPKPCLTR